MKHEQLIRRLIGDIRRDSDEFHAFIAGMKAAFQHEAAFKDFDDFEAWLDDEWNDYQDTKDDRR